MDRYIALADELIDALDQHRHIPPESLSNTLRGEVAVLRLLNCTNTGLSAGYISRELHMTTSRIAAVLNSLEKKNMIERTVDVQDRRRIMVQLTAKGKCHCQAHYEEARARMTALLFRLGESDATEFTRLTKRVFDILAQFEKQYPAPDIFCKNNDTEK